MGKETYIRHIKELLKTYHPDMCPDSKLMNTYNEISIKLIKTLKELGNDEIKTNENILENKIFDIFSFRYYLSKIQSIGINKNSMSNKDYLIFKNLLVSEIKKSDERISEYFLILLSSENIKKDSINLFANGYAGYNSIFQNYFQYNDHVVKHCITVSKSYFNDYIKKCDIEEIERIINEIEEWLQKNIKIIYSQWHCT